MTAITALRVRRSTSGALVLALFLAAPPSQAWLDVTPADMDLGILTGDTARGQVTVRNDSDAALSLVRITSQCPSCLSWSIERRDLGPGEATKLELVLLARDLTGPFRKTLTLVARQQGGAEVSFDIVVRGIAAPPFNVTPRGIVIQTPNAAFEFLAQAIVVPRIDLHAPLEHAECDAPWAETWLQPGPETNAWTVYLRNVATMPNGLSSTEIRVRGSDPNDPVCTIPVTVRAPGMFELVPSTLRFEQDDAPQLRLLFIRQHGKHPVSVLDVRSPGDKIKCEIYAEPSRPDYRVYVRAQDLGQARGFVGDVVVTTDRAPTDEVGAATAPWTIRVPVVVGLAADETAPEQ